MLTVYRAIKDALIKFCCCYGNLLCHSALLVGKENNTAKFETRPSSKQALSTILLFVLLYLGSLFFASCIFCIHKSTHHSEKLTVKPSKDLKVNHPQ